MKLGISGQALGRVKTLEEILTILVKHDVHYIELWPDNIPVSAGMEVSHQDDRYEGRNVLQAKELITSFGIEVACVTVPGAFNKELAANPRLYAESLAYGVEVAKELGAPVVNHYCAEFAMGHQGDITAFVKVVAEAVTKAEQLGVTLALEPEAHDVSGTPAGMLQIIETVSSRSFLVNFDACNFYHASQEAFPFGYQLLRNYIGYVHLKNGCLYTPDLGHTLKSKGVSFGGHLSSNQIYYPILSEGAVNIDGLLRALVKDGYQGFCTLEPHTKPEYVEQYYAQEIAYLHDRGFFGKDDHCE